MADLASAKAPGSASSRSGCRHPWQGRSHQPAGLPRHPPACSRQGRKMKCLSPNIQQLLGFGTPRWAQTKQGSLTSEAGICSTQSCWQSCAHCSRDTSSHLQQGRSVVVKSISNDTWRQLQPGTQICIRETRLRGSTWTDICSRPAPLLGLKPAIPLLAFEPGRPARDLASEHPFKRRYWTKQRASKNAAGLTSGHGI